jgi:hypothetical protein
MPTKEYNKQYYKDHKDECKNRNKVWRDSHKDKVKEDGITYRALHKAEIKVANASWRKSHVDSENTRKRNYRNAHPIETWANATLNEHKRKFNVEISQDDLVAIAKNTPRCQICDILLKWEYGKGRQMNSPTLDRKYNEDHINKDNIMLLCNRCNVSKGNGTLQEYIDHCKKVASIY